MAGTRGLVVRLGFPPRGLSHLCHRFLEGLRDMAGLHELHQVIGSFDYVLVETEHICVLDEVARHDGEFCLAVPDIGLRRVREDEAVMPLFAIYDVADSAYDQVLVVRS